MDALHEPHIKQQVGKPGRVKRVGDRLLGFVHLSPLRAILCTLAFGISIYLITIFHWNTTVSQLEHWAPVSRAETIHFVNLIALAGVIFSGLGFLYTYIQLQDFNSRIENYQDFYRWIAKLFEEIEGGKASEFYFYGATILPGNVAMKAEDAEQQIGWFKDALNSLFNNNSFSHVKRPTIIVPPIDKYRDSYRHFDHAVMSYFGRNRTPEAWKDYVKEREDDAKGFQRNLSMKSRGEILTPRDARYGDIKGAYFFSNGKRVIFAKPLHYTSNPASGDKLMEQTPHLVGFTTKDSMTIEAFREHFSELSHDRDREHLLRMYSKHLISPQYLNECVKELAVLDVDTLAEFDHDHFGQQISTNKFLEGREIRPDQKVLDIGSGFGGPARYIAHKKGCTVHGIELQSDRCSWAMDMTERLVKLGRLQGRVEFVDANICDYIDQIEEKYDYVIAFLSILHLPHKERFLKDLGKLVKPGGSVYIEDYVRSRKLLPQEEHELMEYIACPPLLTVNEYVASLQNGGLTIESNDGLTKDWLGFAKERVARYDRERDQILRRNVTNSAFAQAQAFNRKVVHLFEHGAIRGIRIVAKKT
jgi:cyclopropane fatty-acyl-phospholipid synthase-like methyltransferase